MNGRETKMGAHDKVTSTRELFDLPDHDVFVGGVLNLSHAGLELGRVDVGRDGDGDGDVVGR